MPIILQGGRIVVKSCDRLSVPPVGSPVRVGGLAPPLPHRPSVSGYAFAMSVAIISTMMEVMTWLP